MYTPVRQLGAAENSALDSLAPNHRIDSMLENASAAVKPFRMHAGRSVEPRTTAGAPCHRRYGWQPPHIRKRARHDLSKHFRRLSKHGAEGNGHRPESSDVI